MINIVIGDKNDEQVVRNIHPQHPSLMYGDGFLFIINIKTALNEIIGEEAFLISFPLRGRGNTWGGG